MGNRGILHDEQGRIRRPWRVKRGNRIPSPHHRLQQHQPDLDRAAVDVDHERAAAHVPVGETAQENRRQGHRQGQQEVAVTSAPHRPATSQ
jgi:hypothetical protein